MVCVTRSCSSPQLSWCFQRHDNDASESPWRFFIVFICRKLRARNEDGIRQVGVGSGALFHVRIHHVVHSTLTAKHFCVAKLLRGDNAHPLIEGKQLFERVTCQLTPNSVVRGAPSSDVRQPKIAQAVYQFTFHHQRLALTSACGEYEFLNALASIKNLPDAPKLWGVVNISDARSADMRVHSRSAAFPHVEQGPVPGISQQVHVETAGNLIRKVQPSARSRMRNI